MKIKFALFLAVIVFSSFQLNAQMFGYLNSNELLSMHPLVKGADSILTIYQNQLMEQGQKLVEDFQKSYEDYVKEANSGNLSKIQMGEKENELALEQNKLREYEQEMQKKVLQKREELYKPILDNIQTAINTVGKEFNFTFIFDTGAGGILFALPGDNIIDKVKAKLGF
jgi:outer membrane protein